jgi:hypothetical protein
MTLDQKHTVTLNFKSLIKDEFDSKISNLDAEFETVDQFAEAVEGLSYNLTFAVSVLNEIILLGQDTVLNINKYGGDSQRYVFPYGERMAAECLNMIAHLLFNMYKERKRSDDEEQEQEEEQEDEIYIPTTFDLF